MTKRNKEVNTPDLVTHVTVQIKKLAVREEQSGWRQKDDQRIAELKKDFLGGKYGLTVASDITILERTNLEEDHALLDHNSDASPKIVEHCLLNNPSCKMLGA